MSSTRTQGRPLRVAAALDKVNELLLRVHIELAIDALDVSFHGVVRQCELVSNVITVVPTRKHPEHLSLTLGKTALARKGIAGALDERIAIGRHVNRNGEFLNGLHTLNRDGKGKAAQAENHIGKEGKDHNARDK